jgi:hypothetical protein
LYQTGYFVAGGASLGSQPASVTQAVILTPEEQKTMSETMRATVVEPAPQLGPTYTNKKYRFSVQMPADYRVQELPVDENGGQAITLQNTKGDGVQIYITPDKSGAKSLSGDDVRISIPDMRVVDDQVVEIGETGKGVAFMSDNDAYHGASREVWFYFDGNLYQISTYARLDNLLKSMFGTWQFF